MTTTQDAPPLVERDRRRADFRRESVAIKLADGQEWYFPKPSIYYVRDHTEVGFLVESGLGSSFDQLLLDYRVLTDGQNASMAALIRTTLAIAELMLLVNYDLDLAETQRLLHFRFSVDESDETREGIMRLALGMGGPPGYGDEDGKASPKPGSDGFA